MSISFLLDKNPLLYRSARPASGREAMIVKCAATKNVANHRVLANRSANELFLFVGFGHPSHSDLDWRLNGGGGQLKFSQNLLSLIVIFFLVY